MTASAARGPRFDPTPIFEIFRGSCATELLTAAVSHLRVFEQLRDGPLPAEELRARLDLDQRPFAVLGTALRAFGLLEADSRGRLAATGLAREHLDPQAPFDISDYIALASESPGVLEMVERLRSNRPAGSGEEEGAAFIYREGLDSAMEREDSARRLTLSLAGRARNVAPVLAEKLELDGATRLLDVGGGSGIYSIAVLQRHSRLEAVVLDRPEVLKVAREMAEEFAVSDRLHLLEGDMFEISLPANCQLHLLSNVLHDWDVPECRRLVSRCAAALPAGGRLVVHDVFLDDSLDGPLPIALYSASLFRLTEGRAYSGAEYRGWLEDAGLRAEEIVPTLVHCGFLTGRKARG